MMAGAAPTARRRKSRFPSPDARLRGWHAGAVEPGERMLIRCEGGPSMSRLVRYPPPVEVEEDTGLYVLVDDGPPEAWWYTFVPREL